jgi:hypothetical protein
MNQILPFVTLFNRHFRVILFEYFLFMWYPLPSACTRLTVTLNWVPDEKCLSRYRACSSHLNAINWIDWLLWGETYVSELLPLTDILFIPQMIYEYGERRWNDIDRGNRRTRRKACPSATLSTTNPTWIDPGANSGLRGERPASNRLSHGTAD